MAIAVPPIISVDDHLVEPPDLWQRWLPARHRERGPSVIRAPFEMKPAGRQAYRMASSGPETDFWVYGDFSAGVDTGMAAAGIELDQIDAQPIRYEQMRPGCYQMKERLRDMDLNGVERSLCFPTFPRFCGQVFLEQSAADAELALACVRAYNDFMVEEWCGDSGGRLIPCMIVPLWDPHLAAAEIRRNAERGVRAVTFSEIPQNLGLPSLHDKDRHWDPFIQACDETGIVICTHIGSGSRSFKTAPDSPPAVTIALTNIGSQMCMADWLFSGVLSRFRQVKLAFSESQIGWMPYQLQRFDHTWRQHRLSSVVGIPPEITEPPSSYVEGRIYGCVVEDDLGIRTRGGLGVDQITFEADYPHMDSNWPNTRKYAERVLNEAGYTEEEIHKVARGNAIELFQLPETILAAG